MLSVNSHCISSILLLPQNNFSSRSLSLLRLSLSSRASVLPIPPILSLLRLAISIPFSRLISLFHFRLPCILFLSLKFAFLRLILSRALFSLPYLYFLSPLLRSIPLSLYLRFRFLVSSSHFLILSALPSRLRFLSFFLPFSPSPPKFLLPPCSLARAVSLSPYQSPLIPLSFLHVFRFLLFFFRFLFSVSFSPIIARSLSLISFPLYFLSRDRTLPSLISLSSFLSLRLLFSLSLFYTRFSSPFLLFSNLSLTLFLLYFLFPFSSTVIIFPITSLFINFILVLISFNLHVF